MDSQGHVDWNIEIGQLVIEGITLTNYQQARLKEALVAELSRMFADRGRPEKLRPVRGKITGEPIGIQGASPAPDQLGKQIATSVYNTII